MPLLQRFSPAMKDYGTEGIASMPVVKPHFVRVYPINRIISWRAGKYNALFGE
jgi:hypothetical protein